MNEHAPQTCRLCGGDSEDAFQALVLGEHEVAFARCRGCGSLQSERPHWLDQAYADPRPLTDTGIVQRTLDDAMLVDAIMTRFGVGQGATCVDWGGGNGLFARTMRDRGYDFYCYDRYVANFYLPFHDARRNGIAKATVLTAFEVLEHLPDPATDLSDLFAFEPDLLIASSATYADQGADWPYLSLDNGQHVFFYSLAALEMVAERFGYRLASDGNLHIFHRASPRTLGYDQDVAASVAREFANTGLREAGLELWRHRQRDGYRWVLRDHERIIARLRRERGETPRPSQPPPAPIQHGGERRVVVDGAFYQLNGHTGIARVWNEVLKQWSGTPFGRRVVVLDRGGTATRIPGIAYAMVPPHQYHDLDADRALVERYCRRLNAAAFCSTYYSTPLTVPSVMLVYDMIPEVVGADPTEPMWHEKGSAIAYAQRFVCISYNTRNDLLRFHPGIDPRRVATAHLGVSAPPFQPPLAMLVEAYRAAQGLTRDYLLFVGARHGYKNALALFDAWRLLPEADRPALVFIGPGKLEKEVATVLAPGSDARLLDPSDDELALLYAGAAALVVTSLYEGFGLPLLEAMACGCPVVTSPRGALAEVAGDAALIADPADTATLAAMLESVRAPAVRQQMTARGLERASRFTWDTIADALRKALETVEARRD